MAAGSTADLLGDAARATSQPGAVAGRGAQTANAERAADPQHTWTDVWTRSYDGAVNNLRNGNPSPVLSAAGAIPTVGLGGAVLQGAMSLPGVVDGLAGQGWHSASPGDVGTGMRQQLGAVWDAVANLFHGGDRPPPAGALGHFGAFVSVLTNIEQLICMPLSMIPTPALPAVRVLDLDVGLPHAHGHPPNLTPPNPVPVPLPSTGPVLPIPYVSGAATVLINGMPAGRCGDMGAAVWCGGFFPFFEIFLGSSSVWIEGARAARVGIDITKHCIFSNPKSIVKAGDNPIGPPLGFTVGSSPNVLIGGFPLPSLTSMALGAMFKALFKGLGRLAQRVGRSPVFQKFIQETFPWLFRPVATATGAVESRFSRFMRRLTNPRFLMSPEARDLLDNLQAPGARHQVTSVNVKDLADITAHTGDEFGVVRDRHGNLVVVRGEGPVTNVQPGDTWLAHTHPHTAAGGGQHPLGGPGSGYQAHPMDKGWDPSTNTASPGSDIAGATASPEAQIYQDGNVTYFNNAGPMNAPPPGTSPVSPGGVIDGNRH